VEGRFVHTLGTLAALGTAFYSRRLIAFTFLRAPRGARVAYEGVHESPLPRALPLVILSFGSLILGYVSRDRRIGLGTDS